MEEIISKQEIDKLMSIGGETRGVSIKNHRDFILKKKGQEGLKKFEKAMSEIGQFLEYKSLQETEFYPVGLEAVELLVIKALFGFSDKEIEEMGAFESRVSLLMKFFFHYFVSLKTLAEKAPAMWRESYTVGSLSVKEWSKEKKYAIIVIENFSLHPVHCVQMRGYIANILKMMVGTEVSCQESKCTFNGNECHEFILRWK
jgi:hypothetical protein